MHVPTCRLYQVGYTAPSSHTETPSLPIISSHRVGPRTSKCEDLKAKISTSQASHSYPLPENTHLLGLCTGAIPAAAVSCARSVHELLPLAVTAVVVAFRTGLCAADAGRRVAGHETLKPVTPSSQSWSLVAAGPGASNAVQDFCISSVNMQLFQMPGIPVLIFVHHRTSP